MNLEQMEYIKEIIHTKSISIAAQNLHVSQSAISQAISLLEKELGIRLFRRSRSGTTPTEEGKSVITKALAIVENMERIKEEAQVNSSYIKGELRIGSIPSFMTFLPKILSQFKKDYPHIKVTILESESQTLIESIKQHTIDIGIISLQDKKIIQDPLRFKKLDYHADVKAIVPKDSPLAFQQEISIQDLIPYPIVLYTSQFWENVIKSFERNHGPFNVLFQSSNSEVIKKTVSEGLAVGLLSSYNLVDDPYVESNRIVPVTLEDHDFISNIYFGCLTSTKNVHNGLAKRFLNYLQSYKE